MVTFVARKGGDFVGHSHTDLYFIYFYRQESRILDHIDDSNERKKIKTRE